MSQKLALNSFFQLRTRGVTKEQKRWTGTDPGTNTQLAGEPSLRQPLVQGCARPAGHPASHSLRPAGNSTRQQLRGPRKEPAALHHPQASAVYTLCQPLTAGCSSQVPKTIPAFICQDLTSLQTKAPAAKGLASCS